MSTYPVYPLELNLALPITFYQLAAEALGITTSSSGGDANAKRRKYKSDIETKLSDNGLITKYVNILFFKTKN